MTSFRNAKLYTKRQLVSPENNAECISVFGGWMVHDQVFLVATITFMEVS